MNTLEVRSIYRVGSGNGPEQEVLHWQNRTPEQVRDELYPGFKLVKALADKRSLRAGVNYCRTWRLENPHQKPGEPSIYSWLIELP